MTRARHRRQQNAASTKQHGVRLQAEHLVALARTMPAACSVSASLILTQLLHPVITTAACLSQTVSTAHPTARNAPDSNDKAAARLKKLQQKRELAASPCTKSRGSPFRKGSKSLLLAFTACVLALHALTIQSCQSCNQACADRHYTSLPAETTVNG